MKRNLKKLTIFVLTLLLVLSQVSYAKVQSNNGKGQAYGQLKKLEGFTQIDGKRIKVNDKHINFDVPPVIKGGRTLIPVRAITESLGCTVEWDKDTSKAYVISPNKLKVFVFDLKYGTIFIFKNLTVITVEEINKLDSALWTAAEIKSDAPPAIHNNRTFVPLRFIAEELGLKVSHDSKTGNIDIREIPALLPTSYTKVEFGTLSDLSVALDLKGYTFVGIEKLRLTTDYTVADGNKVTLLKSYLDTLTVPQTELKFVFTQGSKTETKVFKINLNYLSLEPTINNNLTSFSFDEFDSIKSVIVDVTLNGFSIERVYAPEIPATNSTPLIPEKTLEKGNATTDDYTYTLISNGASIVLSQKYLDALTVGTHTLNIEFLQGSRKVTRTITLIVRLDPPTVVSVSNDTYIRFQEEARVYTLNYNRYTFDSLAIAIDSETTSTTLSTTEYSFNLEATQLTILNSYLDTLAPATYSLNFTFKKGENIVIRSIPITITILPANNL